MGRSKKTVPYRYKDKRGEKRVGFIDLKKARQVKSQKEACGKKRKKEADSF